MAGWTIDTARCIGCGLCVKSCPTDALVMKNEKAQVDPVLCTLCGMCIDTCPVDALSIVQDSGEHPDRTVEAQGIWVFAEQHKGQVAPVTFQLLGKGRELADSRKAALTAVLIGNQVDQEAKKLIAHGADRVLLCQHPVLEGHHESEYMAAFNRLMEKEQPEIFLFGATSLGRSLAPRLAARLNTGLTADCTQLTIDGETELLHQTRPAFGGNLMATIVCPHHRPQMATVRPGVMPALAPDWEKPGTIVQMDWEPVEDLSVKILAEVDAPAAGTISDARIIVSAGRGIGSQKNMILVKRLAGLLGGHVGVSRPLVDTGWSDYRHQIGQTGSVVAPRLLIACGVSGAIQHLAGIGGAETVIAINSDPEAPIFSVADYKVVGDCVEILKKTIAELEKTEEQRST